MLNKIGQHASFSETVLFHSNKNILVLTVTRVGISRRPWLSLPLLSGRDALLKIRQCGFGSPRSFFIVLFAPLPLCPLLSSPTGNGMLVHVLDWSTVT
jgi:hypothetical protein